MSSISKSVLKNLSLLVPEQIFFISLVEYKKQHWYLCLGKEQFYFIGKELKSYLNPPIEYKYITACKQCTKKRTLIQIVCNHEIDKNATSDEQNIHKEIIKTYGMRGSSEEEKIVLNIYNQDRKAVVDSFTCYWQISTIRRTRQY